MASNTETIGHGTPAHDEEHASFIKTPKQLIAVVVASFLVPIIVIVMLVNYVGAGKQNALGEYSLTPDAIEQRIQPVAGFALKAAGSAQARTGEEIYKAGCSACHASGAAGSPKFGDKDAWAPRIATGYDALLTAALKGKGAMPAQSGGDASDFEISRAVVYMANNGGASFEEPKEPKKEEAK